MNPIKELTNVTHTTNLDKDNIILFFDNGLSTVANKKTFSEIYNNIYFKNWRIFNKTFYLAQRESDDLWTLVYKETGKYLNEDLWFYDIDVFDNEFFIIIRNNTTENLQTLVYKNNGKYFNSDIWGDSWEHSDDDNHFKVFNNCNSDCFNIVNKKEKKLLCESSFIDLFEFDDNLFVVQNPYSYTYTFIKKENGEYLNENLLFDSWGNLNNDMCLVKFDYKYHFIKKSDGTVINNFPILDDFYYFGEEDEFIEIRIGNGSKFDRAILRKSDCSISPLFYKIIDFNKVYFAAFFDPDHLTLIKKSDFSLLCNFLCINKNYITSYPDSNYFTLEKEGKIYLYE